MAEQPTLYLMLGYPGAGKTTIAKMIHDKTGAVHLWADHERRQRFGSPTYSHQENLQLYDQMNIEVKQLLSQGKSVIFDTNFNFYKDREHLRQIAQSEGAKAIVVWVNTPKEVAHERATDNAHLQHTRVLGNIPHDEFDRMSRNLEPPKSDEPHINIDGTRVSPDDIEELLANVS